MRSRADPGAGHARGAAAAGRAGPARGAAGLVALLATALLLPAGLLLPTALPATPTVPAGAAPGIPPQETVAPGTPQATATPPADSATLDALTARVADQLRCPVCRSQSVLESSSTLAREMKGEIRRRLAEGQTPEEVKAYFVSRYGEWVLLRPEPEGLNLMVYLFPPLLLVGGGLLVWSLLRRWTPRSASATGPAAGDGGASLSPGAAPGTEGGLSEAEERRLEEAIRGGGSDG